MPLKSNISYPSRRPPCFSPPPSWRRPSATTAVVMAAAVQVISCHLLDSQNGGKFRFLFFSAQRLRAVFFVAFDFRGCITVYLCVVPITNCACAEMDDFVDCLTVSVVTVALYQFFPFTLLCCGWFVFLCFVSRLCLMFIFLLRFGCLVFSVLLLCVENHCANIN